MEITQEYLKSILHYDPESGVFTWKSNFNRSSANTLFANKEAGCIDMYGYIQILIDGKKYRSHRLSFLYMTGNFPKNQVDHIDCNGSNNKWINLREATHSENQQNQKKAAKNNKSTGVLGVYFNQKRNRFRAHIGINKKDITLGWFKTLDEARDVYINAKRSLHSFGTL